MTASNGYGAISSKDNNEDISIKQQHNDSASSNLLQKVIGGLTIILGLTLFTKSIHQSYKLHILCDVSNTDELCKHQSLSLHDENEELFYNEQLVNHFNGDKSTWSNRYYKSTTTFKDHHIQSS